MKWLNEIGHRIFEYYRSKTSNKPESVGDLLRTAILTPNSESLRECCIRELKNPSCYKSNPAVSTAKNDTFP